MKTSARADGADFGRSAVPLLVLGGSIAMAAAAALAGGLATRRVLQEKRHLHHTSKIGRETSASVPATGTPLTSFNRYGQPGDPINVECAGTDGQIGATFAAAGWYRADEIDFVTAARISADSALGRTYTTAPVSNLYLFGRKEDLAFERPGRNVRQRDHIRFWKTERTHTDGRPIWVGSGTQDTKVELSKTNHLPTHGIAPDLDAERSLIVSELAQTGYVVGESSRPGFGKATHGVNGGGDPYFTDGQVVTLTLANVWTSPLATQVRSPLGARLAQGFESMIRGRLPERGLTRAQHEREKVAQHAAAAHEAAPTSTSASTAQATQVV
jgi:LssY C-terminus